MFRVTDPQVSMFECQFLVPPVKRARLESSWAHPFQARILPLIDEEMFRACFDEDNGRPNKSIRLLAAAHLLKEWEDLTDAQVVEQIEFNLQWHYALAIEPGAAHVCQKTLHNFRTMLIENERAQEMFKSVTKRLVEADGLGLGRQRLDSTHVISNIAVLTRLGLFVETVTHFLKELRQTHPEKLSLVGNGYVKRYLDREGYFADAKREQARRRLAAVAMDIYKIVTAFEQDEVVRKMEAYKLLVRLFDEQCEVVEGSVEAETTRLALQRPTDDGLEEVEPETEATSDEGPEDLPVESGEEASCSAASTADVAVSVKLKEPREISSGSLQSPHDPDATYGHKGKGYEVQIAETCDKDNAYQVITAITVNGANESDQQATVPMTERLVESGLAPKEIIADTGYGSGENIVECAKLGVSLVAPVQDPHAPEAPDPWEKPIDESVSEGYLKALALNTKRAVEYHVSRLRETVTMGLSESPAMG